MSVTKPKSRRTTCVHYVAPVPSPESPPAGLATHLGAITAPAPTIWPVDTHRLFGFRERA